MSAQRTPEAIALDVLQFAIAQEPNLRVIGNVTAREIAVLAVRSITTCPKCGAEAWVNIDCDLCLAAWVLRHPEDGAR